MNPDDRVCGDPPLFLTRKEKKRFSSCRENIGIRDYSNLDIKGGRSDKSQQSSIRRRQSGNVQFGRKLANLRSYIQKAYKGKRC